MYRDDDCRILASLTFVHRDGIAEPQLVQLPLIVVGVTFLKPDADAPAPNIARCDPAYRAVENSLFVVIAKLDYTVTLANLALARTNSPSCWIQELLQFAIEHLRAEGSAIHRSQHLYIGGCAD